MLTTILIVLAVVLAATAAWLVREALTAPTLPAEASKLDRLDGRR